MSYISEEVIFLKNKNRNSLERSGLFREKNDVLKDSEHRIATAQSPSTPLTGVDAEGAMPLKNPMHRSQKFRKEY